MKHPEQAMLRNGITAVELCCMGAFPEYDLIWSNWNKKCKISYGLSAWA
jgi:ATP-dependent protease Clp ATPase subunit